MKATVLCDNNTLTDHYFLGEPGFSLYIEIEGKKIIYDCGYSNVFLNNAMKMGINLLDLDYIVFSHGHLDHTWGLQHLIQLYTEAILEKRSYKKPTVIAHPHTFLSRYDSELPEAGSLVSEERTRNLFRVILTEKEYWITDNLLFLGQIHNEKGPMNLITTIRTSPEQTDHFLDDAALVYKNKEGIVIFSGCAHAGITNIIEAAKQKTNCKNILDVVGGFHTMDCTDKERQNIADYFYSNNIADCHPCHCTDLKMKCMLFEKCRVCETGVGLFVEY